MNPVQIAWRCVVLSGFVFSMPAVQAQSVTVTQQFLGASVPGAVLAVELDAAPSRAMPRYSNPDPGSGIAGLMPGAVASSSPDSTSAASAALSPPMYTGAGVAGSTASFATTLRAYDGRRDLR